LHVIRRKYATHEEKEIRVTIHLKEPAAKWLANREVKREHDALAPEFEAYNRKRGTAKTPKIRGCEVAGQIKTEPGAF
jgi:thymidylate synthase ThyX